MKETIEDIANKICYRYQLAKKSFTGKTASLFNTVCENVHGELGLTTVYPTVSEFKSVISTFLNSRKRKKKKNQPMVVLQIPMEVAPPTEGDGLIFTQYQINELGLNPDSY